MKSRAQQSNSTTRLSPSQEKRITKGAELFVKNSREVMKRLAKS